MDAILSSKHPKEQEELLKTHCKASLLSMYPAFSRQIKFDKANTDFVLTSCFADSELKTTLSKEQPEPKALSAISMGDNSKYFIQYLVFYERLDDHIKAYSKKKEPKESETPTGEEPQEV